MNVDEAEKKAIEFIQSKFNAKKVNVTSVDTEGPGPLKILGRMIVVRGTHEGDYPAQNFEVKYKATSGKMRDWKSVQK